VNLYEDFKISFQSFRFIFNVARGQCREIVQHCFFFFIQRLPAGHLIRALLLVQILLEICLP
jgi:hypothetical protein